MGSAAPDLIVASQGSRRVCARLHPRLAGQHGRGHRPPTAPPTEATPPACRPPSRCDRRPPRLSVQPAPLAQDGRHRAKVSRRDRTSRVVAADRTAAERCPSIRHQYQLREHLYMIRYKCLWAMTVGGQDRKVAGDRHGCRRRTSSFECAWPGSISWRGSPRPISQASSASRGCAPTACWARPGKAAWSISRSMPGWPTASHWSDSWSRKPA